MRTEEIPHLILHVNSLTEIISTNLKGEKNHEQFLLDLISHPAPEEALWGKAAQNIPTTGPWQTQKSQQLFLHSIAVWKDPLLCEKWLSFGSKDQTAKLHKIMSAMSAALIYLNGEAL